MHLNHVYAIPWVSKLLLKSYSTNMAQVTFVTSTLLSSFTEKALFLVFYILVLACVPVYYLSVANHCLVILCYILLRFCYDFVTILLHSIMLSVTSTQLSTALCTYFLLICRQPLPCYPLLRFCYDFVTFCYVLLRSVTFCYVLLRSVTFCYA
jgi:hypothetical protein